MKSKRQVLTERPEYKTLINGVLNSLGGTDYVVDVVNHGADAGYPGFTYYNDTHAFAMRYRKMIVKLLEESADMLGEEVVTMVSNFGVFRQSPMDNDDRKDLYKYIGGGKPEQGTITNVMAWFALEEVCRMFED
jgi:hypothetical protein